MLQLSRAGGDEGPALKGDHGHAMSANYRSFIYWTIRILYIYVVTMTMNTSQVRLTHSPTPYTALRP